ncbi:tRNA dihydrouridine synthase [Legionella impletisoli]|uniref:tRNA-dihydrouridine synthase n=1 Tax=Legionella impletisoli TaxID=343510 RepID=A0A917JX33_9GAMM|nr:tRNA-dihydrouridine synthase family protein [Legionella impletisoli]GGI88249.1 tRNA-dihydrouridine synthase [Legionella impletisoli]
MIKELTLRDRSFPVNIIQGPLAGISSAPFRRLFWKFGHPAFTFTEMISCETLINSSKNRHRFVAKSLDEGPVCFQLSGREPNKIAEATKIVTDCGADLIDLNCGCPVNKIRSRGAGSKHLSDPLNLYEAIKAMKANTHVPVSVKIRIDGHSSDQFNKEIAKVVEEAGTDYLIVHGRHWTEHYETPCNTDQIQFFVQELKIPVIGNGDIACIDSLKKMFATGCAGVMIARAGVGQPWLIGQLISAYFNQPFSKPEFPQISALFLEHITELAKLLNSDKFAVIQARKFAKYYARGLPQRAEFILEMNRCESLSHLETICTRYFHLLD